MYALGRWTSVLNKPAASASAAVINSQPTSPSPSPANGTATLPIPAATPATTPSAMGSAIPLATPQSTPLLSTDSGASAAPAAASTPPPPTLTLPREMPAQNPALTSPAGALPPTLKSELGSDKKIAPLPVAGGPGITQADYDVLSQRSLLIPVAGVNSQDLRDSFNEMRGATRRHGAIDILAPRGTPVLAVDDGVVKKLFTSIPGGLTVYEFDGQQIYCYYYAHLDHYASGLKEGILVKRGDLLGYVGTTGDAPVNTPHLHFEISRLGPDKHYWQGAAINPYPILKGSSRPAP